MSIEEIILDVTTLAAKRGLKIQELTLKTEDFEQLKLNYGCLLRMRGSDIEVYAAYGKIIIKESK